MVSSLGLGQQINYNFAPAVISNRRISGTNQNPFTLVSSQAQSPSTVAPNNLMMLLSMMFLGRLFKSGNSEWDSGRDECPVVTCDPCCPEPAPQPSWPQPVQPYNPGGRPSSFTELTPVGPAPQPVPAPTPIPVPAPTPVPQPAPSPADPYRTPGSKKMNINVIKQYDNESCGPACMTMILNAFGKNVTERQIDDQIRAHKNEGLSPSRLLDGARMNGANGTILNNSNFAEIRENLDANNQMIAFVRNNSGGSHFVVISGYTVSDDGEISLEISDPWTGRKSTMDYDKFERDYWTNIPDGSRDSGFDKCIIVFSDRNTLPQQRLSGKAFETDSRWYQMNTRPLAA